MKKFFAPLIWVFNMALIYIKYTGKRINNFFWSIGVSFNKFMLEGNSAFLSKFVDFEVYKKNFIGKYMKEQGFGIPAVTKIVLKNGFEDPIAIHFFAEEHMHIDTEKMTVEPVYTQDLLQTEYFLEEPHNE
jgi:hypothetical protein